MYHLISLASGTFSINLNSELSGFLNYWVGNYVLSQKFGNFSLANATFSKFFYVICRYHQTRSLYRRMHGTAWRTLEKNCAQTWPPWPKFENLFLENGSNYWAENFNIAISTWPLIFSIKSIFVDLKKINCGDTGSNKTVHSGAVRDGWRGIGFEQRDSGQRLFRAKMPSDRKTQA